MQYFQYLDCNFLQDLQTKARDQAPSFIDTHVANGSTCLFREFDQELTTKIGKVFADLGLGPLHPVLWFVRYRDWQMSPQKTHLDGMVSRPWASIVIPVMGCRNSFQYWYDGDYSREGQTSANVPGGRVIWSGTSRLVAIADTSDRCILSRVHVPHGAVSNSTDIRVTCTLRFQENWTFEHLQQRLCDL
jgi:hypothetical protein